MGDGAATWKWGDATGEGTVNAVDIGRVVDCVKGVFPPGAPQYRGCQMWPCDVDVAHNALDIAQAVNANKGLAFPCVPICPE
jgi:hypothetical protein